MSRTILWFVAGAMLAVAVAGCGGPHATPRATFETCRSAVERKDWKTALECLTPETHDNVVGGLLVAVASASVMNEDAAAVLDKHGVDRTQLASEFLAGALANLIDPNRAAGGGVRRCLDAIVDKPAFVADAVGWLEQNSPHSVQPFGRIEEAELSDIQIDGDRAAGSVSVPVFGSDRSLRFRRIDGRWLIDL
jgi:hypothetical protein